MPAPEKSSLRLDNSPLERMHAHDRLLVLLKTRGESTAAQLSGWLGITPEAARQQLVRLQDDGLVEARSEIRGRGRPTQLWMLTRAANHRFPDSHAQLTVQLMEAIRTMLGERTLERLIDARAEVLMKGYAEALREGMDIRERLERLVSLRNAEGYMAEYHPDGNGFLLIENHCPICAASGLCLRFCNSEADVFRRLLGPGVDVCREEHIANGARRCVYRVTPKMSRRARRRRSAASA